MLALDNADLIRGDATNVTEVDYTLHGVASNIITQLASGQLPNAEGTLYTSPANGTVVAGITYVNTGVGTNIVNLYLQPSGGTSRRLIPKNLSLLSGYSLYFDGKVVNVIDTSGQILSSAQPPASYDRTFLVNIFRCPDAISEWQHTVYGSYLPAVMVAKKCWLPLNFLKIGDIITAYNLVGDATETTALTLDCKLVQINKADPLTTTDIANGAIVQVTAGGNFDIVVNPDDTTVATDKQYVLELLGTTGVGDEIYVIGAEISITRLI